MIYSLMHLQVKRILFLFGFLAMSIASFAQNEYFIYGTVKDADTFKKLGDVGITVLKNGQEHDHIVVSNSGKFEFELPLGFDYTVIFEREGYVSKRLFLETSGIPEEDRAGGFETNTDMTLFEYVEGFDTSILEKPIGKAGFDVVRNSMDWDFAYTQQVQAEVEAEFARLENMAEQQAENMEEFEKAVREGDEAMTKEDFAEAVNKYEFALSIIPDDEPVQQKLADAEAKLAELNAAEELEKEYQRLIAEGEEEMKAETWQKAKESFNAALELKPDERLPKDKLKEIDDILANLANREQFDALVAAADAQFENEDYAVSIEKYEAALEILPTEDYPRDQIKKAQELLDAMLDEERRKAELERKYNEFITLADKNFKDEKYKDARVPYQQALDLKPEEAYPQEQLDEIERILAELAQLEEEQRIQAEANAVDSEYQGYLDAGNELFAGDELEKAKEQFILASEVKPEELYPKNKIDEIDALIAQKEEERLAQEAAAEKDAELEKIDREYQNLVDEANELFDAKELESAREVYVQASEVKPTEKYPKSRIQRIDEMLDEMAREAELAEEQDRLAEEEARLAAERERLAEEQRKEEERLKRLAEEQAEKERLAEEKRRQEEAEAEKERALLNNIDSSREDDVERYYREARLSEEKANYNKRVKDKKEAIADLIAQRSDESRDRRRDNREEVEEKQEQMTVIQRKGQDLQDRNKRGKEKDKERWESKDVEWTENFGYRRLASMEKAMDQKQSLEELKSNDRYREQKVAKADQRKEQIELQQDSYEKMGRASASDAEYEVDRDKLYMREMKAQGQDMQREQADISEEKKENVQSFQTDLQDASDERRAVRMDKVEKKKEIQEGLSVGKEIYSEQEAEAVELKKEANAVLKQNKAREAEIRASSKRNELFSKDSGSKKDADDYKLPEGAEDLKEGVNETSYEMEKPRKTVIERTVKIGNKVVKYRKVISKTGTYYFKENRSITEATWIRETVQITD